MPRDPRVSVLLPVHSALPHLGDCLEDLASQTLGDIEVVAVDDGSDDGSGELLEEWSRRDPRFRVLEIERSGLVAALNLGLAHCRAELVARMDADDRCDPRRLELQAARLAAEPELTVVSCRVRHFAEGGVGEGLRRYEEWLNSLVDHEAIVRERFIESPLPHPSVVVRRGALDGVGGYRDHGWPEDYDLWLRLARRGARFAKLTETLVEWRDHGGRLTRTDARYAVERFLACKAHHLLRGPLRGVSHVILWGAGQTGRRLSKYLKRAAVPIAAVIDIDPAKIGRTLRGYPIRPPEELPQLLRPDSIALAAVSSRGARAKIRRRLEALGLVEAESYWCVA